MQEPQRAINSPLSLSLLFKLKNLILSLFTLPCVVLNLHGYLSSTEQKRWKVWSLFSVKLKWTTQLYALLQVLWIHLLAFCVEKSEFRSSLIEKTWHLPLLSVNLWCLIQDSLVLLSQIFSVNLLYRLCWSGFPKVDHRTTGTNSLHDKLSSQCFWETQPWMIRSQIWTIRFSSSLNDQV